MRFVIATISVMLCALLACDGDARNRRIDDVVVGEGEGEGVNLGEGEGESVGEGEGEGEGTNGEEGEGEGVPCVDEYENNNTFETAAPIAVGTLRPTMCNDQFDFYVAAVPVGCMIDVRLESVDDATDLDLWLYAPDE